MITCEFKGELGNNLFTLAALINKALENNFEFCIPTTRDCYVPINERPLEIPHMFDYNFTIENHNTIHKYISPDIANINPKFTYTPFNIEDNTTITGYFQSEKYFSKYAKDIIQKYYKPKEEIFNYIKDKYNNVLSSNCLSIHIRVGGDRVWMQDKFTNISMQYYEKAINTILQKDSKIEKYIILSDNIPYCKELFGNDENIIYIENEKNYIDLFLMTKCNHNIIANSTFSWWAAYLNQNPDKIVVAPKSEWFGSALKHLNIDDLFPSDWILL
jgi:hypothetical protein